MATPSSSAPHLCRPPDFDICSPLRMSVAMATRRAGGRAALPWRPTLRRLDGTRANGIAFRNRLRGFRFLLFFFFNHRVFCVCVWRGASISSQSSEELRLADEKIRLNRQGSRLLLADGLLVSTGSTTGFHDPC